MLKVGKFITKFRYVILVLAVLLLIPCGKGYIDTKINYDILSYLPGSLETVEGMDKMVEEFGMGAFSMVVVDNLEKKDAAKLETEMEGVEHVADVLWVDDFLDTSVPESMLPKKIKNTFYKNDSTLMVVLFDNTTSADETMTAIQELRKIVKKNAFIGGMSSVVTDIKDLVESEMMIYVLIAALLVLLVLEVVMDSYITPFIFLLNIGMAIVYNMGSNFFLKDVSYLTEALAAIMQLACTMDYSIFLLDSYRANKEKYKDSNIRAMSHAISNTFVSVSASSLTTVAGFAALMVMSFGLGGNIGVVMMKGVLIGVLTCITVLPAWILLLDKWIEKTTHKHLMGNMEKPSRFIVKHRWIFLVVFALLLIPAAYGSNHYKQYFNIAKSLPSTLPSSVANDKLKENFDMASMHIVMLKGEHSAKEKTELIDKMEEVDGVKYVLGLNSLIGPMIPESMIPNNLKSMLKSDNYELMFVGSDYDNATDPMNQQVKELTQLVKDVDQDSALIGEAPLMSDLADLTVVDQRNVNILSIGAIMIIILLSFKSISLPLILVAVIELAININMAVPFYMNSDVAFIASVVIGTIQLGSTVDYAILMTSHYHKARTVSGMNKKDSILKAHELSMPSILTSGMCFFAATFGVSMYSKIDIIKQICTLLSRGAVISMITVIGLLPAALWLLDPVIIRSSWDMIKAGVKNQK